MNVSRFLFSLLVGAVGAWASGVGPASGRGPALSPNLPDAGTLHLWHLDESGTPFADAGLQPLALEGMLNCALAGLPSRPGLGQAVSFHANAGGRPGYSDLKGAVLTVPPELTSGEVNRVPEHFRYAGEEGAFTIDLVLKLDLLPQDAPVIALGLVSMDGETNYRVFNFRIEKEGFLAFIPLPDSGSSGGGIATLPVTGPHALAVGPWFHAAVVYDGNAGVTNNLKLYWTRLGPGLTEANLIGQGTLSGDLNGTVGNLALGNEARVFTNNAQGEPFPGLLDEVRISGVARHASDFLFVPAGLRRSAEQAAEAAADQGKKYVLDLGLASLQVNGTEWDMAGLREKGLELAAGLHRLDFEFGIRPGQGDETAQIRYQFEGIDDRWHESGRGMVLICQAVDAQGRILSLAQFPALGRSRGWETTLEDSTLTPRREPLFIPAGTTSLRLVLSSGSPDTTGSFAIDQIQLTAPGEARNLWENGGFDHGDNIGSPAGVPAGWGRRGTDAAIARCVYCRRNPAVGLVDGDQAHHGEWTSSAPLTPGERDGRILVLAWEETYNVIGGTLHWASYVNVPPGHYTFRVIGLAGSGSLAGEGVALPVVVRQPFSERVWFWPSIAAGGVGLIAAVGFRAQRRRARQRLERLHFQHGIERDRTRIARDMHDDLGTRVTVLNMTAALALRDWERDPDKARRHLDRMNVSARDLVVAMDDLVWAVNPAHDTLDHLASHLTRLAGEMFTDSPVRCRLDIPAELPARLLSSEFRHHLALAVKEAMHNILQHAGPFEAEVALCLEGDQLCIIIRDHGVGFDPAADPSGNGQGNLQSRAAEIHGQCLVTSRPGKGTCVRLICQLPDSPA